MPDYFTIAEFRGEMPDMDDSTRFTDAKVERAAAYVVDIIERYTSTAFIPRAVTETVVPSGRALVLGSPVASLTSLTFGGTMIATSDVTFTGHVVSLASGLAWPYTSLTVTYVTGESTVPPAIREVAMQATRDRLLRLDEKSALSDRRQGITNDFGNVTFALPGPDRPFGLPEVDAVLAQFRAATVA